jgi:hypothetical protein
VTVKGFLYRIVMKLGHRYHWHYMKILHPVPPFHAGGDTLHWCQWCGIRVLEATHPARAETEEAAKDE